MQTYKIEHTYGCGSIGELFVEADSAEEARRITLEDFNMESEDILNVEEVAA